MAPVTTMEQNAIASGTTSNPTIPMRIQATKGAGYPINAQSTEYYPIGVFKDPNSDNGIISYTSTSTQTSSYQPNGYTPLNLWTNLEQATAAKMNTVRLAFQMQKALEKDARGGTRYVEMIKAHFGVTSPMQGNKGLNIWAERVCR